LSCRKKDPGAGVSYSLNDPCSVPGKIQAGSRIVPSIETAGQKNPGTPVRKITAGISPGALIQFFRKNRQATDGIPLLQIDILFSSTGDNYNVMLYHSMGDRK
jgi:hypothetical protein